MVATSAVARDGSPVAVYLNLELEPEFTPLLERLEPPSRVLDLGCGVGRLANHLAANGFAVTGVDESSDMLAHLADAVTPVEASLVSLDLPGDFDDVVLASHLVNVPDVSVRTGFLTAAARHTAPGGRVFIAHYDPDRMRDVTTAQGSSGTVGTQLEIFGWDGDVFDGSVTYRLGDQSWIQEFSAELLDGQKLDSALHEAGLEFAERLSSTWIVARRT